MIDYEVLCQAINDWRTQQRPPSGPHDQGAAPEAVEEIGSGLVVMDDEDYEEEPAEEVYEAAGETAEQPYEEAPAEEAHEEAPAEEVYEEAPAEEVYEEAPAEEVHEEAHEDDEEIPVEE
jgi:hypothetical protein